MHLYNSLKSRYFVGCYRWVTNPGTAFWYRATQLPRNGALLTQLASFPTTHFHQFLDKQEVDWLAFCKTLIMRLEIFRFVTWRKRTEGDVSWLKAKRRDATWALPLLFWSEKILRKEEGRKNSSIRWSRQKKITWKSYSFLSTWQRDTSCIIRQRRCPFIHNSLWEPVKNNFKLIIADFFR